MEVKKCEWCKESTAEYRVSKSGLVYCLDCAKELEDNAGEAVGF